MAHKEAKKPFIVVGNWKMNPQTREEAKGLFAAIARLAKKMAGTSVIVAAPAVFTESLAKSASAVPAMHVAVQDVSEHQSGAFTGSISASEAQSVGAEYAVIGHSERRAAGDSDEIVAKKVAQAVDAGLKVILCVGESARDTNARYLEYVRSQVLAVLSSIDKKAIRGLILAYEPVWAIGKSYDVAPKPSDIHEMAIYIKKVVTEVIGKKDGIKVPVLYGGSVDVENARVILRDAGVDGLLVGRQSLDPKAFNEMIAYAESL